MNEQNSGDQGDKGIALRIDVDVERVQASKMTTSLARLARLGLGLVLVGRDELDDALQRAEKQVEMHAEQMIEYTAEPTDTDLDQMRYLALGSALKFQKSAARGLRRGVRFSLRASGAVLGTIYAFTDNPLLRPVRRSMDEFLVDLARETDLAMRSGRIEEERSKALARQTIGGLVNESIGSIAENPQVTNLIKQQLASQSVGISQLLMDSLARYAAQADDYLERVIRRILRMKPRSDLSESPIAGKPQLMYLPESYQVNQDTK